MIPVKFIPSHNRLPSGGYCAWHSEASLLAVKSEQGNNRVVHCRAGYKAVLEAFPDGRWRDASHFVAGDRGVSEWTFTATGVDGKAIEVRGCDLFTFRDGKIAVKNSFRKSRSAS